MATGTNQIVFVNKQQHMVYSLDLSDKANPRMANWPGGGTVQLPPVYFPPGSFTHRLSLLYANRTVWIPSHRADPPGAFMLNVDTGVGAFVSGTSAAGHNSAVLGSVGGFHNGAVNADGKSAFFLLSNATHGVEMYKSDGTEAWQTTVTWNPLQRNEHPSFVDLPGACPGAGGRGRPTW